MDKLIAEKETKMKIEEEKKESLKKLSIKPSQTPSYKTEYLNSLENLTLADLKKQQEQKEVETFKEQKEEFIQNQFEPANVAFEQKACQKVIEKPNYDLMPESKKVVKLEKKKKDKKKFGKLALCCALGACALICVANTVIIDQMNADFVQIDETYQMNLASYLKKIYNLDTTKKSMEMIETYPDDLLDAGDLGQQSNWFDKLCNFFGACSEVKNCKNLTPYIRCKKEYKQFCLFCS